MATRNKQGGKPTYSHDDDDGRKVVKALHPYTAACDDDLSFEKNDRMKILLDDVSGYYYCQHLKNGKKGYVPPEFVAPETSLRACDWYMPKFKKKDAVRYLTTPGNRDGTFLVRKSETAGYSYTLSVKHSSEDGKTGVYHYRIKELGNAKQCCVTVRRTFNTITELVEYYKENLDEAAICCLLTVACPVPPPALRNLSRKTKYSWEIGRKEITLNEDVLGGGHFSSVREGVWNKKTKVAVKILNDHVDKEKFLAEASIMRELNHRNLVSLLAVCTQEPYWLITEFMSGGSLEKYLRSEECPLELQLDGQLEICAQIAEGMAFMERKKYIHRDLAARNILIGDHKIVKIADFGLSRLLSDPVYIATTDKEFAYRWCAPEVNERHAFTTSSDVWAFGVVMYEIISYGRIPYAGMEGKTLIAQVKRGYRLPQPDNCPSEYYEMMRKCWESDPTIRPTFQFISEFFDYYITTTKSAYGNAEDAAPEQNLSNQASQRSNCTLS